MPGSLHPPEEFRGWLPLTAAGRDKEADSIHMTTIPEQGQLVEVRNRKYAVVDVSAGHPDAKSLVSDEGHTLVRLASVEDDGIGEEISVIWNIEPGAHIFSEGSLPAPDGFDPPSEFECFMNAVRWGVISPGRSRDLQAPFRASVDGEAYQLEPLVRALQMPRVNMLIADDVGLGKTIEAGLIAYELMLRHKARRMLIVCPASLQVQWRDQMRDKFGLDFRIVNSDLMKELRRTRGLHVNPWSHFPRLITSIDYLKRERPMRLFREVLPGPDEDMFPRRFDLLIVDEAHNVAPPGTGKYATDSQRTMAVRNITPHFEHRLFLTATPHNGYSESFSALLELIDDQRFARGIEIKRELINSIMVRRLKTDIVDPDTGKKKFPERKLIPLEIQYTDDEREAHSLLQQYTEARRESDDGSRMAVEFVLILLKKRLFSSPAAFGNTLRKHVKSLTRPRTGSRSRKTPPVSFLKAYMARVDEDYDNEEEQDEATLEVMEAAAQYQMELRPAEKQLLTKLENYAESYLGRADSKAEVLLQWIKDNLFTDGKWNNERLLIFTEYRDTQKWLYDLFAANGFCEEDRTLLLHGGVPHEDRERIKAAFQAHPDMARVRILLATDSASEGVDLQNHCSKLIHYEIPWNPNRLEQRNGRLDRHGQKASEVQVFHFVGAGYQDSRPAGLGKSLEADLEFLFRAARKVETIRADLGEVSPVLAEKVSQAMVGRSVDLEAIKVKQDSKARKLVQWEKDLKEKLRQCRDRAEETQKELHIYPDQMKAVADLGLRLAGKPPLEEWTGFPEGAGRVFRLPESLSGSWAQARYGIKHPHTGEERPITFDQQFASGRDDVVHVHLNHPLLRLSSNLLRAQIWSFAEEGKLNRWVALVAPQGTAHQLTVLVTARLLVLGSDQQRLHEELLIAGGELVEGKFKPITKQGDLQGLADVASTTAAGAGSKKDLQDLWPEIQEGLEKALDKRIKERTQNLESNLHKQREAEIKDITEVLEELRSRIQAELDKEEDPQLILDFNDTEQKQYRRDRENLKRRLERIPGEIEQETEKIRKRYESITPRVFPVAVTTLVPENRNKK